MVDAPDVSINLKRCLFGVELNSIEHDSMKNTGIKRHRVLAASLLVVGLGLLVRAWLVRLTLETPDSVPSSIKLSAEFDPILDRIDVLRKCHEKKHAPKPGDWMEKYPEGGQSFADYVLHRERTPLHPQYQAIDIQPLGEFDQAQQRLVAESADFMERFFGMTVRILDSIPLEDIPPESRRMRDNVEQVLSPWILKERLLPLQRSDAVATIGVVLCDLWPGQLNWVFGEAIPSQRVAVWSLHRFGDPRESDAAFRLCLLRSVKTAVHEAGHVLGMPHCGEYECGMNGTRSLDEHDRRLLEFCPVCQAKIWWTCGANPDLRCHLLAERAAKRGWHQETTLFEREETLLRIAGRDTIQHAR